MPSSIDSQDDNPPMETDNLALRDAVIQIDLLLTQKSATDVAHTARHQQHRFQGPMSLLDGEMYYLSDGGYSRIFLDQESLQFKLASVSRDEVKTRWTTPECQAALRRGEEIIQRMAAGLMAEAAKP